MTGALALKPIPSESGIEDKFSETRQKFLSRYPNRARHISKKLADQRWTTVKGPLFTGLIDAAISCTSDRFFGAHWGPQTNFAVLDIDVSSTYHNQSQLAELLAAVESVGLAAKAYRSSDSGGWHLYLPFDDHENSSQVEQTLKRWLKHLGYEIASGQLEVFPSGNALRLPLQPGFAWLDNDGSLIRTREQISLEEALTHFIEDQEANAQSWTIARSRIESQICAADRAAGRDAQERRDRLTVEGFDELFKYLVIQEQCDKARAYLASGLVKSGTRHDAIYAIEHLLWHGDSALGIPSLPGQANAARRYEYLRAWLEQNHNGYCRHINRGDWDRVESHIRRACQWQRIEVKSKFNYEPYKLTERAQERLTELSMAKNRVFSMDDFRKANEDRQEEARAKIKQAVSDCLQDGRRISRRRLQAITGCSPNTIRKHADLWGGLSKGSGVLISGGLGAVVFPCPDSELEEEKKDSSDFEIDDSDQAGCVLDSLRYDRTGQTAKNSRQVKQSLIAAVHPIQSNYGVKHKLEQGPLLGSLVASEGMDCGINGILPASGSPPFIPRPFFCMGAPARNLRQVGTWLDGFVYNTCTPRGDKPWLSRKAQRPKLDRTKPLAMSSGRAFGCVPLSCYDKRRQRVGGWLLSPNGYIALGVEAQAMGNESHEKPEQQERPTERQTEHVKRAQGEVTNAAESYTEQVKAHRIEKKLSGNSGATGQLADKDGKGLASAKDLLGDDAHGLSKKEKQAALLAQVERDGYIVGKAQNKPVLAAQESENKTNEAWLERKEQREKNYPNDVAEQLKDALYTPRDGQTWKLSDFLSRAHSPIIEAYELSKHLEEGQPGKSKTLEEVIDRLKTCPWADQIQIKFDKNAHNPEYDNASSTITIKPQEPGWQQIDTFAHEAFHATHQTLKELYIGKEPISLADFQQVKADAEIGSFETEIKVHRELDLPGKVTYDWKNSQNHPQEPMDLGELYGKEGRSGLSKFLMLDAHTEMLIQGHEQISNYHQYHESTYDDYLKGFQTAKKSLEKMFGNDPAKVKKIVDGHY